MRESGFQLRIAAHQRIICRIGDLGRILGMIEPVVMRDLLRQPHQLIGGFGLGDVGHHSPSFSERGETSDACFLLPLLFRGGGWGVVPAQPGQRSG